MALQTVWSVDVGKSSLKAVKLRRDRNNIEILAVDKVDYPVGPQGIDPAAAKEALGIFKARNDVKEPVAITHPGQGTFYRAIKVPASDEKKLDSMVGFEASQQIPFPLDEVIWDYHIIDKEYLPGEERDVALFAVRREALDDFSLDFTEEGLTVDTVSIGYLGLLNFVQHDLHPEEPSIILDIGASHTDLILVDGDHFWIRPLPHSGTDITKAIAQRFKLGYPEAEKLKLQCFREPKQALKIFQAVVQPKLKELVGEVHRSIGYYRSQAGEASFKHLFLLGNGSKVVGAQKFLSEQLGLQVHRVQSINRFRINQEVDVKLLKSNLPSFPTALGAGAQALGLARVNVDLVPREEKLQREAARKRKHVFIAAAICALLMLASNRLLNGRIEDAEPVLKDTNGLLSRMSKEAKAFSKIDPRNDAGPKQKADQLEKLGASRRLGIEGLRVFENVLAGFTSGANIEIQEEAGATELRESALLQYREETLADRAWVASLLAESLPYIDPEFTESKDRKKDENSVPGVRFEAFVVVKMREDNATSFDFIQEKIAKPLESQLKALEDSGPYNPNVEVGAGVAIAEIFDHVKEDSSILDEEQEGGPFYGAKVTWWVLSGPPPKPSQEKE